MENQRVFLWIALAFTAWLTWQAWVQDYHRPVVQPESLAPAMPTDPGPASDLPELSPTEIARELPDAEMAPEAESAGRKIRITTDVLDLVLDTRGGDLVGATLREYPVTKKDPDRLVQLLSPYQADFSVFRTGIRGAAGAAPPAADAVFSVGQDVFELPPDGDVLEIPLRWSGGDGLEIIKTYRLRRGQYAIEVEQMVRNGSDQAWSGASYVQIRRRQLDLSRSMTDVDTYSFRGPVLYDGEKYEKLDVPDLIEEPVEAVTTGGWIASIQHHFLLAAVPPGDAPASYKVTARGDQYTLSALGALASVAPGEVGSFSDTLFVGPKIQEQLKETAQGLVLSVDYGWLTIISQPLFWVLERLHDLTGNWGWAIILLTVLIKLVFYKLSETSGKSMAKMRKLQPRMKALQERFGDDRQGLSQAMMELYKREKVNPASGCLPILVQMPVFLALYWVLLESVEMRQAPFMLWIDDLSSKDPYFILPLLMGITMFIQQKLNPAPPDPVQAKVMMALPIVFTVFFAFFPAGLVLYWFVNNLLSIAQQWRINRVVEAGH
ncbi:MAG: membrane protein insertase YidC [Gammaproteobacteria bacterium]|jgi:YidC/Oxa1 family membrane protein insertase